MINGFCLERNACFCRIRSFASQEAIYRPLFRIIWFAWWMWDTYAYKTSGQCFFFFFLSFLSGAVGDIILIFILLLSLSLSHSVCFDDGRKPWDADESINFYCFAEDSWWILKPLINWSNRLLYDHDDHTKDRTVELRSHRMNAWWPQCPFTRLKRTLVPVCRIGTLCALSPRARPMTMKTHCI